LIREFDKFFPNTTIRNEASENLKLHFFKTIKIISAYRVRRSLFTVNPIERRPEFVHSPLSLFLAIGKSQRACSAKDQPLDI